MFSDTQITTAALRLSSNKITPKDRDSIIENFRLLVGSLETTYSWDFEGDIDALDDSDGRARAAKLLAGLLILISKQFSVVELTGKNGVALSNIEKRRLITLYMFNILYKTPKELTEIGILTIEQMTVNSSSVYIERVF